MVIAIAHGCAVAKLIIEDESIFRQILYSQIRSLFYRRRYAPAMAVVDFLAPPFSFIRHYYSPTVDA